MRAESVTAFSVRRLARCCALAGVAVAPAWVGAQTDAPLRGDDARIEALQRQIDGMQRELQQLRRSHQGAAPSGAAAQPPAAVTQPPAVARPASAAPVIPVNGENVNAAPDGAGAADARPTSAALATPAQGAMRGLQIGSSTVLTSYGEMYYSRYRESSRSIADLARFVIGFQHRFSDRTKVVSEFEVEHAVSSATDAGEAEVEQLYIEHAFSQNWAGRAGLFLMPAGLLNETHEPTAYYGVHRNFVETAIIPTTWREGGLQGIVTLGNGLTAQAGVTTSFNLSKWDATSTEGQESPLGSIHQEMQLAGARSLGVFGALNWRGVPGLLVGASVFNGGARQVAQTPNARITLWDVHARLNHGIFDVSALLARGSITNTQAWNTPLVGSTTLIPKAFWGGYLQAAARVWSRADQSVSPFVRWEAFNTASSYAPIAAGLTPAPGMTRRVWTLGVNWLLTPGVVLKADVQKFPGDRASDRLNLGVGYAF